MQKGLNNKRSLPALKNTYTFLGTESMKVRQELDQLYQTRRMNQLDVLRKGNKKKRRLEKLWTDAREKVDNRRVQFGLAALNKKDVSV